MAAKTPTMKTSSSSSSPKNVFGWPRRVPGTRGGAVSASVTSTVSEAARMSGSSSSRRPVQHRGGRPRPAGRAGSPRPRRRPGRPPRRSPAPRPRPGGRGRSRTRSPPPAPARRSARSAPARCRPRRARSCTPSDRIHSYDVDELEPVAASRRSNATQSADRDRQRRQREQQRHLLGQQVAAARQREDHERSRPAAPGPRTSNIRRTSPPAGTPRRATDAAEHRQGVASGRSRSAAGATGPSRRRTPAATPLTAPSTPRLSKQHQERGRATAGPHEHGLVERVGVQVAAGGDGDRADVGRLHRPAPACGRRRTSRRARRRADDQQGQDASARSG